MKRVPFLSIILAAISIPSISFLWTDNTILTALLLIISVSVLAFRRRYLSSYLLAALIGTTTETVAIFSGAWSYSNPTFIIPIWLPMAWGIAGLIFKDIMDFISTLKLTSPNVRLLPLQAIAVPIMSTAIISLFWRDNLTTTVLVTIILAAVLFSWRGSLDFARFSIAFVVGPIMEVICVYYGAWAYANPILFIPPWLPFAWGFLGISIGRLDDFIVKNRTMTGHLKEARGKP